MAHAKNRSTTCQRGCRTKPHQAFFSREDFRPEGDSTLFLVTVTSLEEAHATETAGMDAIVAQGIEAGGHRGIFGPTNHDDALGTFALIRLLLRKCNIPVIAAGGIMDGAGMAAAFALGAFAAQMGTAFILCPETDADEAYRKALAGPAAFHTCMTDLVSGRPARCLQNRFTGLSGSIGIPPVPDYPIAYDAGKRSTKLPETVVKMVLALIGQVRGPLARAMPVNQLMDKLKEELREARCFMT